MSPARKGDGTPLAFRNIQEVRKGDGTVLWTPDKIPDSLIYEYVIAEGSGQTLADSEGDEDISTNFENWIEDSQWESGWAKSSDGDDDHGAAGTMGDFGSSTDGDFAVEITFRTSDTGSLIGVANSGGNENMALNIVTSDDWGGQSDYLTVALRDDGDSAGDFLSVDSSIPVTDNERYHVIWNKTGNSGAGQEIVINGEDRTGTVNEDAFDETQVVNFDEDVAYFNRNSRGSFDLPINAEIASVRWFGDSLTEQEMDDLWDRQPFS